MGEALDLHTQFLDSDELIRLGGRLAIDLFFALILVFGIYARRHGKTDYVFTYVMFNLITFTLCFMLRQAEISIEFALGLFAVFGILRYRTEAIRTQDLTYMFVVIGIAILNAVANKKVSLAELLLVNGAIVALTALLERLTFFRADQSRVITYDNMDIIRKDDHAALIADLRDRTGLNVQRVRVGSVNLLRDTAQVVVYFPEDEH